MTQLRLTLISFSHFCLLIYIAIQRQSPFNLRNEVSSILALLQLLQSHLSQVSRLDKFFFFFQSEQYRIFWTSNIHINLMAQVHPNTASYEQRGICTAGYFRTTSRGANTWTCHIDLPRSPRTSRNEILLSMRRLSCSWWSSLSISACGRRQRTCDTCPSAFVSFFGPWDSVLFFQT